jgi:hypothetical protein
MVVKQTHLIAFLIILAIAVGYVIQRKANESDQAKSQAANVTLCVASVTRGAYMANGFDQLAQRVTARDKAGDNRAAKDYAAAANSIRGTFPGEAAKDGRVERVEESDGTVRFALSEASKDLIRASCRQVYK